MEQIPIEVIDIILNKLDKETLYKLYKIRPELSWLIVEKLYKKEITLEVKYDEKLRISENARETTFYENIPTFAELRLKELIKLLEVIYKKEGNISVSTHHRCDEFRFCIETNKNLESNEKELSFTVQYY